MLAICNLVFIRRASAQPDAKLENGELAVATEMEQLSKLKEKESLILTQDSLEQKDGNMDVLAVTVPATR